MELNDELRQLIMANADASRLTEAARRNGMRNLREDGWMKVRAGHDDRRRSDARHAGILTMADGSATFHYRAVAPMANCAPASSPRRAARPSRANCIRQGLTPVYVGVGREERSSTLKLPSFGGGRRRDVLFFTQELSTLLNSGVPLDRALSITSELTTRPQFRTDRRWTFCAPSKAASRWPMRWRCIPLISPTCSSTWCGRAKRPAAWGRSSNGCRNSNVARRTARLHHFVDDLSGAAGAGGRGLDLRDSRISWCRASPAIFDDGRMKIPLPTLIMLQASKIVQDWWWLVALV